MLKIYDSILIIWICIFSFILWYSQYQCRDNCGEKQLWIAKTWNSRQKICIRDRVKIEIRLTCAHLSRLTHSSVLLGVRARNEEWLRWEATNSTSAGAAARTVWFAFSVCNCMVMSGSITRMIESGFCAASSSSLYLHTLCEVVGFADVDADQGHELELRETLTRRRRQGQQVPQIGDLWINQVTSQFGCPFGRLRRVKAETQSRALLLHFHERATRHEQKDWCEKR